MASRTSMLRRFLGPEPRFGFGLVYYLFPFKSAPAGITNYLSNNFLQARCGTGESSRGASSSPCPRELRGQFQPSQRLASRWTEERRMALLAALEETDRAFFKEALGNKWGYPIHCILGAGAG
jgi:hypothetical protein